MLRREKSLCSKYPNLPQNPPGYITMLVTTYTQKSDLIYAQVHKDMQNIPFYIICIVLYIQALKSIKDVSTYSIDILLIAGFR
jgi:hypothetical protein